MDLLINIDNGGTLTDFCVIDGARIIRTKTITTPHDLSQCFFDGLKKASRALYGKEDLLGLLLSTSYIRYSTTQGTNALVERKGPRLGLILGGGLTPASMQGDEKSADMYAGLIGLRTQLLDTKLKGPALDAAAVVAVNALSAAGANRIVVAFSGADRESAENQIKRTLLRTFPPHLLGAIPILYAHELVDDADHVRCAWSAIFNAFLHPAMERFLYSAEHKLRELRTRNPLLIFRNDGHSARVAKTIALKTYSSGPRGGMEGARALARNYGLERVLSMDIGGTTTDIGLVEHHAVRATTRGSVQGVATSFAFCDVVNAGVGGSSIIRVADGKITVGPQSVGSAPGPACFGLGGLEATITDAFLLGGLLDPSSYFGGELKIDVERARAAIAARISKPLGLSDTDAVKAMEAAWAGKVAQELRNYTHITPDTTLAAFGGAGPFVVCKVAEAAGIGKVIIPGLAAVFSAYGIGFSDIGHEFSASLEKNDVQSLEKCRELLLERAKRGMFAEGASLEECRIEAVLNIATAQGERSMALANGRLPAGLTPEARLSLTVTAVKPVAHATITGRFGAALHPAVGKSTRKTWLAGKPQSLPLYRVEEQRAGATAKGPAVLEEAFFTCRIDPGWQFEINDAGDILLSRIAEELR
jgi:N-methylhydantoinase A/oxoprolinase/acetone carboxylase beta subunit